jgi:hypothetical protein
MEFQESYLPKRSRFLRLPLSLVGGVDGLELDCKVLSSEDSDQSYSLIPSGY